MSQRPLAIVSPTVSNEDVVIRSQIDTLDVKLKKAIKKVDESGDLDKLAESEQFQELSTASIKPIIVGNYGRNNPFLPVERIPSGLE